MNPPLWSIMIPTYNSAKYLRQTIESVLQQAEGLDAQFCVVDNGSTDETEAIVSEAGKGQIHFIRNESNYGVMGNFNRCVTLAEGKLVHILNSDDLVLPGFYKAYEEAFASHSEVYIISSNSELIDDKGRHWGYTRPLPSLAQPANDIREFMYTNPIRTPAVVVRREAYEQLGGFDTSLLQTGDWDMWTRVIRAFKGLHLHRVLTQYREHAGNESSKVYRSGENLLDTERLFEKFLQLNYPIDKKKYFADLSLTAYAQYLNLKLRRDPAAATLKAIFARLNAGHSALASAAEQSRLTFQRILLALKQTIRYRIKG